MPWTSPGAFGPLALSPSLTYTGPMDAHSKVTPTPQPQFVEPQILDAVSRAEFPDPHVVLGPHVHTQLYKGYATVRTLKPSAQAVTIVTADAHYPASAEHNGIFVAVIPTDPAHPKDAPDYRIVTQQQDGTTTTEDDPYRFLPTLGPMDIYLIGEGRHENLWQALGAHARTFPDPLGTPGLPNSTQVDGYSFAVWVPNARAVRVMGDFNDWDGRTHAMRRLGDSGVWEIFVPGVTSGTTYKYEILTTDGTWLQKADPLENYHELPPLNASVTFDSSYAWSDNDWMERRAATNAHLAPMSIYEVHAGSWKKGASYRDLARDLVDYVRREHFTHVEFMPLAQYPFPGSWGYQVTGYYAPDSRGGTPDDFRYLIDALHQAGIGVILDWVPAHFPKDDFALARFDGTPLYEDPDPLRGEHPDWGTYVFNYGRPEIRNFLVANAVYWLKEFHLDGLRVDAVASMLYLDYSRSAGQWRPNRYGENKNLEAIDFLKEMTATAYKLNPGTVIIAEESTAWPGITAPTTANGLGFGLKWNMGWMHDTLSYFQLPPLARASHHDEVTFSMVYAYSEHYLLPLSHDEVVHGKGSLIARMPGTQAERLAQVRELFAFQWTHPGRKLTFMGNEFAQDTEWNFEESLDWEALADPGHAGVQRFVADLNALYQDTPALWEEDFETRGFEWLTSDDTTHNTLSFVRYDAQRNPLVVVINFSGADWQDYQVPLPAPGPWREILTSDDKKYGGSGYHNGAVEASAGPYHSRNWSAKLTINAFSAIFLKPGS